MLVVDLRGLFQGCQGWDITWQEAWWQYHFILPGRRHDGSTTSYYLEGGMMAVPLHITWQEA